MKYKHLSWKQLWQCYPRTLFYVPYTLFFSIMYIIFHNPLGLLFMGFGFGCVMTNYYCETYHTAANRKKMIDETLEMVKKEHVESVRKIIGQIEQMHTQSVVDEAERIRKQN